MTSSSQRCQAVMARTSEERVLCEEPADPARHDPQWHVGFSDSVGRYTWAAHEAPEQRPAPAAEAWRPAALQD